jgi:hypothetical protein
MSGSSEMVVSGNSLTRRSAGPRRRLAPYRERMTGEKNCSHGDDNGQRQARPASQRPSSNNAAQTLRIVKTTKNVRDGLRGLGRSRLIRPDAPGAGIRPLHSGQSNGRPEKPSGTRTVEPQVAQVRAATGALHEVKRVGTALL